MNPGYPTIKRPHLEEYVFETNIGAVYEVYFYSAIGYFPVGAEVSDDFKIFGFYASTPIKSFDSLVSNSIVKIVTDYFSSNPDAVLLFAYDQSEGKQDSRKRLFKRWFNTYALGEFYKMDLLIDGTDYASAIFLTQNPHRTKIISALKALTNDIESK